MEKKPFIRILSLFSNREELFNEIINSTRIWKIIGQLVLLLFVLTFFYGFIMGLYHSFLQAVVTGLKIPVLFLGALIICFPAIFIIQLIIGSKLRMGQMLAIILAGLVLMSIIMASFAPIVFFFFITGSHYNFLQILHVLVFIFAGVFGMLLIVNGLKYACDEKGIYPKVGVTIFQFWIVIMAFVGIQLAWNLRPFLGDSGKPFALFRKYEGNFYQMIINSVKNLGTKDEVTFQEYLDQKEPKQTDRPLPLPLSDIKK
jgi:hypothetical protein